MKKTLYRIELCDFKQEEDGPYEPGILLNEGELGILDITGTIVSEIWSWERRYDFALVLSHFVGFNGYLRDDEGN